MKEEIFNWFGTLPLGYILQNNYVFAIIVLVVVILLSKLVLIIYEKVFKRLAKKTKTELDDIIFEQTEKPVFYLVLALGLRIVVTSLDFNGFVTKIIDSIMAIVIVFVVHKVLDIFIKAWGSVFAKKTKTKIDDILLPLIHKISVVIFFIIGFMWVLKIWEFNITPYLAGVGISGLILGMALQDSLKNVFGGVSIILDKTYRIGDKIKIDSGEVGEVYDIGLRSTKIRTYDNEIIIIPNGNLSNSKIQNYTKPTSKVRVNVDVGVEYGTDVDKVKKIIIESISKMKDVLENPTPCVNFVLMGDFSLHFKLFFWVDDWKISYSKKLEATELVYNGLNKAKIGIAFPTQTIHLKK